MKTVRKYMLTGPITKLQLPVGYKILSATFGQESPDLIYVHVFCDAHPRHVEEAQLICTREFWIVDAPSTRMEFISTLSSRFGNVWHIFSAPGQVNIQQRTS